MAAMEMACAGTECSNLTGVQVETPTSLCATPNQHALPAQLELYPDVAIVRGYQQFTMTPWTLTVSPATPVLAKKCELIQQVITPDLLHQRTILDLGASAGFFALWSLRHGAAAATCVDMDTEYVSLTQRLEEHLQIKNLRAVQSNVDVWNAPADIVYALALVHWLYSCTAVYGSLDAVIGKLASLTNDVLLVEWIAPEDEALRWFGHTSWNHERTDGAYDVATFEAALGNHFARFWSLGPTMPHRTLYVAYKSPHTIEHANPLPLLEQRGDIIASRRLMRVSSTDYWSRVYDDRDARQITKHGTLDLAAREARFLSRLTSAYFPRVIKSESDEQSSTVVLERIDGPKLADVASQIRKTPESLTTFALHCIKMLEQLQDARIWHRDIHLDNIIVRDGCPVLIDFGWAISLDTAYENPAPLSTNIPDHDGVHADTYKMGRVIEAVNAGTHREISMLTALLCDARSPLRLTDLGCIRSILELLQTAQLERQQMSDDEAMQQGRLVQRKDDADTLGRLAHTLYEMVVERQSRLRMAELRIQELTATLADQAAKIAEIDERRVTLERSVQDWDTRQQEAEHEVLRLHREIEQRDALLDGLRADIEHRDAALAVQAAEIEQRNARLVAQQDQLTAIQQSRAWRVAHAAGAMRRRLLRADE